MDLINILTNSGMQHILICSNIYMFMMWIIRWLACNNLLTLWDLDEHEHKTGPIFYRISIPIIGNLFHYS